MSTETPYVGDTTHHLQEAARLAADAEQVIDDVERDATPEHKERVHALASVLATLAVAHATMANTLVMSS